MCTLRFHGVRTALLRRSGTALTACRQNGNDVSVICTFCFQEYPLILALASVCENDHAENFLLPPTMALSHSQTQSILCVLFHLCLYRTMLAVSAAICICCACIRVYTSNKSVCCSIDIVKFLYMHVHLI